MLISREPQTECLGSATGQEGLVKRADALGIALNEFSDLRRDRLQPIHERKTLAIMNECARLQRSFEGLFDRIPLAAGASSDGRLLEFATPRDLSRRVPESRTTMKTRFDGYGYLPYT